MKPLDFGFDSARFPSFRPDQLSTAQAIADDSSPTCILRAPPGRGKTLINLTVAQLMSARTLYLTHTRQLQTQLLSDFADAGMVDVRGADNYLCCVGNNETCATGRDQCDAEQCPYLDAIRHAKSSSLVVTNYAFHLYRSLNDTAHLGKFDLIICDEAHLALDWLTDVVSFDLTRSTMRRLIGLDLPDLYDIASLRGWATGARLMLLDAHKEAVRQSDSKLSRVIVKLGQSLRRFLDPSVDWTIEHKNLMHKDCSLRLRPVWPAAFSHLLFGNAAKAILCSATISDADPGRLGRKHFSTFALSSTFPVDRRPVLYVDKEPHIRVDRRTTDAEMQILCDRIGAFAESTQTKGIIQSPSYALTDKIRSSMRDATRARLLVADRRNKQLEKFTTDGPWILVSPSLKEGIDFPYDACRWVIFPKVPFPYFGDALLRARCDSDSGYSTELTTRSFVQMALRASRAADDYCMIVILDAHYAWWKHKANFEPWFLDACENVSQVPTIPQGVFTDGISHT